MSLRPTVGYMNLRRSSGLSPEGPAEDARGGARRRGGPEP